MERTTKQELQSLCDWINKLTNSPMEPWTVDDAGKYRANIGNYHISGAYGGVSLERMVTDGGGVQSIFGGFTPKRELADKMRAFIKGLEQK